MRFRTLSPLFCLISIALSSVNVFSQTDKLDKLLETGHFKAVARTLAASTTENPESLYLLSKIKQAFRKHDEALQLAQAAVKANPNEAAYHLQLASVLGDEIDHAGLFKKMSLGSRIRSELESAIKLEPRNPDCLFGMMLYDEQAPAVAGGGKDKALKMAEEIGRIDASKGYLAQARLARDELCTSVP